MQNTEQVLAFKLSQWHWSKLFRSTFTYFGKGACPNYLQKKFMSLYLTPSPPTFNVTIEFRKVALNALK